MIPVLSGRVNQVSAAVQTAICVHAAEESLSHQHCIRLISIITVMQWATIISFLCFYLVDLRGQAK